MTSILVHDAFALGDAAAARPVETDGMHLVHIGHGVVTAGEIGDRGDRRDVAMHRIKALEDDQLGALTARRAQELFEMGEIVMAENLPLRLGAADAFDHRIVVELIREDQAIGQQIADRGNRRQVGNPARGKDERRLLAMEARQFTFEFDEGMIGARNIAGAAGTGAVPDRRRRHRLDHLRMPAHAEIVVGTPNCDFLDAIGSVPQRPRKRPRVALDVGEDTVAALPLQL